MAPERAGAPHPASCSGLWSSFSKGQTPIPERVLFIHDFLSREGLCPFNLTFSSYPKDGPKSPGVFTRSAARCDLLIAGVGLETKIWVEGSARL